MAFPTHIVAAGGYVFDGAGNILIVKTHNRGWDCTGGQVEIGESLEEGVLREILEESGITARIKCLCGIYSNVGQYIHYDGVTQVTTKVMFDFICEYISGEPTPSEETSEVMWVPAEYALDYITVSATRYRLEKILGFSGKINYASYVTHPEFKLLSERFI